MNLLIPNLFIFHLLLFIILNLLLINIIIALWNHSTYSLWDIFSSIINLFLLNICGILIFTLKINIFRNTGFLTIQFWLKDLPAANVDFFTGCSLSWNFYCHRNYLRLHVNLIWNFIICSSSINKSHYMNQISLFVKNQTWSFNKHSITNHWYLITINISLKHI